LHSGRVYFQVLRLLLLYLCQEKDQVASAVVAVSYDHRCLSRFTTLP